ncbi:MAG TPA: hypothetical protein PLM79_01485 [Syntrophobacteraceae bacterium]|nr:hypothetical protein [Syntrophobacteraceae bacterium]
MDRLRLLSSLSCDWWVLDLREEAALLSTPRLVRELMNTVPGDEPAEYFGMI